MDAGMAGGSAATPPRPSMWPRRPGASARPEMRHSAGGAARRRRAVLRRGPARGARSAASASRSEPLPPPCAELGVLLVSPAIRLGTARGLRRLRPATAPTGRAEESAPGRRRPSPRRCGQDRRPRWPGGRCRLRDANDLWPAAVAVAPILGEVRTVLEAQLDRPVLLTGSGSTLFALYPSSGDAADAGRSLAALRPARARRRPGLRRDGSTGSDPGMEVSVTKRQIVTSSCPGRHGRVQPGHRRRRVRLLRGADRRRIPSAASWWTAACSPRRSAR